MNSELEAILKRRRRRAERKPPSPDPAHAESVAALKREKPSGASAKPTQAIRDALKDPPPPPPPGLPPKKKSELKKKSNQNRRTQSAGTRADDLPAERTLPPPTESDIDAAVTSNQKDMHADDSSSDGEHVETPSSTKSESEEEDPDSNSAAESDHSQLEYEPPPAYTISASLSLQTQQDMAPVAAPPSAPKQTVALHSRPLFNASSLHSVVNPLSRNIIVCSKQGSIDLVHEFDPKSHSAVASIPILTQSTRRKMAALYKKSTVNCVAEVVSMAAGVHRAQRRTRVRVAALVDFKMMSFATAQPMKRGLLIWQWGYAPNHQSVALQSIIKPPATDSDCGYSPGSLQVADGLCFLSGTSKSSTPCIYVSKTVQNSWSCTIVGKSSCNISATAVASTKESYLAVGLTDGSIRVWDYSLAVAAKRMDGGKSKKPLLVPLYQLEATAAMATASQLQLCGNESQEESDMKSSEDAGHCTHLEWSSPDPGASRLVMIAAAYSKGVAVFHVSIPKDEEHSASEASSVPLLEPFAVARISCPRGQNTCVTWLSLGPHSSPHLAILCNGAKVESDSTVVLCVIDLPHYNGIATSVDTQLCPIRAVCETRLSRSLSVSGEKLSSRILGLNSIGSIACHHDSKILVLSPVLTPSQQKIQAEDPYFLTLRQPVTSQPSGLDSVGSICLPDSSSDREGILSVVTMTQCESRSPTEPSSESVCHGECCWSSPVQRHWLCRTRILDSKDSLGLSTTAESSSRSPTLLGSEGTSGGTSSSVVCELRCSETNLSSTFVPNRIVRCKSSGHCAVLFTSTVSDKDSIASRGVSVDPSMFAVLDSESSKGLPSIEYRKGRDIAFLPNMHDFCATALVLSEDGSSIQLQTCQGEGDEKVWREGVGFRPFLGVSSLSDYSECRRVFVLSSDSQNALLMVGTRVRDGQAFIACGRFSRPVDSQVDGWSRLLPNLRTDPVLWLEHGEYVVSVAELPRYEHGRHCIAICTHKRVILAELGTLKVLAAARVKLASGSLAPIGSHAVCFCSTDSKVQYLCGLSGRFSRGVLATLPSSSRGYAPGYLLAVRPDRFVIGSSCGGVRLLQRGENEDLCLSPSCETKPALLLEPLVANALCECGTLKCKNELIRVLVEKFGRKMKSLAHAENEGIGNLGSGLTPMVFDMLSAHGFDRPASWLLTGDTRVERMSNCRILPAWAPMPSKANAAMSIDSLLQVLSSGDQYFSDYVKSPDQSMASSLPRTSDPSVELAMEFARKAMTEGKVGESLRLLDVAGAETCNGDLLHLMLSLQLDPFSDVTKVLETLCGYNKNESNGHTFSSRGATCSLAALALDMKMQGSDGSPGNVGQSDRASDERCRRWIRQLSPSIQRGHYTQRSRHRLIGDDAFKGALSGQKHTMEVDNSIWDTPFDESHHVWNEGRVMEKENLLLLDRMEDWLGCSHPSVLGEEGAAAALERGEKTLADILSKARDYDDDSFGGQSEDSNPMKEGWVEGIGEGRTDEDNLSAYFRMSEGADEDSMWRTEGLVDLTRFQHRAIIVGSPGTTSLQPTTSAVDEGEPGKVKALYDLVFGGTGGSDSPSGMAIEVQRGGSLDVGILHGPEHTNRKKCSIEFWYHLPSSEKVLEEIVLARRSVSTPGEDILKGCVALSDAFLWELVVLPSGVLEFRTSGGSSMASSSESGDPASSKTMYELRGDIEDGDQTSPGGFVSWQRQDGGGGWNHVCLVFSSRDHSDQTASTVSLLMKGEKVASAVTSVVPPGLLDEDLSDTSLIDDAMQRTVLAFCINSVEGIRITEVRVWSCERSQDDCKMMMYEYLRAAETRRKFKLKIRSKRSVAPSDGKSSRGLLSPPPREVVQPVRGRKALRPPPLTHISSDNVSDISPSLREQTSDFQAVFEVDSEEHSEEGPNEICSDDKTALGVVADSVAESVLNADTVRPDPPLSAGPEKHMNEDNSDDKNAVGVVADSVAESVSNADTVRPGPPLSASLEKNMNEDNSDDKTAVGVVAESVTESVSNADTVRPGPPLSASLEKNTKEDKGALDPSEAVASFPQTSPLSASSVLLSGVVRRSAAAALIRGPPATRHFGGNRGGLAEDLPSGGTGARRVGIGAIAICGAEKTVVYAHDKSPPGKTYPIGASGAVISDEMDVNGSEYLCCFLAKEKRMVVFELSTKTVVVELQMTTKLNFWRYLPPQAHGHSLVFVLITPVGGFHWTPLDDTPRPKQVWKRGPDLQGKKIIAYEEGGSTGLDGANARSMVAFLLASVAPETPVEAWIVSVCGASRAVCVSRDALGAALCRPFDEAERFLPLVVMTTRDQEAGMVVEIIALTDESLNGIIDIGDTLASVVINESQVEGIDFVPPPLAMGSWPEVICCCCDNTVVTAVRRKGLISVYEFDGDILSLTYSEAVGHFIVDAAVRSAAKGSVSKVEIVLLLSDNDNPKDGRVVSMSL